MKKYEILENPAVNSCINEGQINRDFIEVGHIRRAKMHVSQLIADIDNHNALPSTLRELLEAIFILQTISDKVLAAHLHRSSATIRVEFQQILVVLENRNSHSESLLTKYQDSLFKRFR